MTTSDEALFGELPPKYDFVFNPYPDHRVSRCPFCEARTGQRKLPLVIYVDPGHFVALNYTCRYCAHCDLLIAHKHEVEHLLTQMFLKYAPALIGNDYLVMGTMEKQAWREGMKQPKSVEEARAQMHDFRTYYKELRVTQAGWYPAHEKPPVREPPPSQEWTKSRRRRDRE